MQHGLRGFNFYMLVDRERWYGAPIRRDASRDERRCEFYRKVLGLAGSTAGARRMADCLLLTTRLYGRLIGLHNLLDPLSPMALSGLGLEAPDWVESRGLGCAQPPAASLALLHEALFDALGAARLGFEVGEPGQPAGNLARYQLAVLPAVGLLARRDAERLLSFVRSGGILAFGPEVPERDERGQPLELLAQALEGAVGAPAGLEGRIARLGAGSLVHLPGLLAWAERDDHGELTRTCARLAELAGCLVLPDPGDDALEVALHSDAAAGWLWLSNPGDRDRLARISLPEVAGLQDAWSADSFSPREQLFTIPMPAWSVRPLRVLAPEDSA